MLPGQSVMAQRILASAAVVIAIASVAACGLLWKSLEEVRRQNRELIVALGVKNELASVPQPSGKESPSDWLPLVVKLTTEKDRPVQGSVDVRGEAIAGGKINQTASTDAAGEADFGLIPPGEYTVISMLQSPKARTSRSVLLGPGRPTRIDVKCPEPPGTYSIAFRVRPPEELKEIPLFYLANVQYQTVGNWTLNAERTQSAVFLLNGTGAVLGQTTYDKVTVRELAGSGTYSVSFLDTMPSDFPLGPQTPLDAFKSNVTLWPMVKDPEAGQVGPESRPALRRLSGAAFQETPLIEPVEGQTLTFTVEPDRKKFWTDVAKDLRRMPAYKELAAAVGPLK